MFLSFIRSHVSLSREYLDLSYGLLQVRLGPYLTTVSSCVLVADNAGMSNRILWYFVTIILVAMEASLVNRTHVGSTLKWLTQTLVFVLLLSWILRHVSSE